jgi:predicted PurR-regulated permease PerM
MLLYGSLLVSMADNFIRPKILAEATKINPAVVLIGLIGGFIAFGLPGIFVGPVVLTLLDLAFELYNQLI